MDGGAGGPDRRPAASGRRRTRYRGAARVTSTTATTAVELVQPRVSWPKRIGIVVALVALGGTVALAGGWVNGSKPGASGTPRPTATSLLPTASPKPQGRVPDVAPGVRQPSVKTTSAASLSLRVTLKKTSLARKELTLKVFRNDKSVVEVAVPKGRSMTVKNVPLKSGLNQLSAAYVGPGGDGPRSNVVEVTLDDSAPTIEVSVPADRAVINAPTAAISGTTEPNLTVTLHNLTTDKDPEATTTATADADGAFQGELPLALGGNDLELTVTDAVGNTGRLVLSVTRGTGVPDAQLQLSKTSFRLKNLPVQFDATLLVLDANGVAVEGAAVTFSLSPPGAPTSTYSATTAAGRAAWQHVTLPDGLQTGDGFVTARVTLGDGSSLQRIVPFTIRI